MLGPEQIEEYAENAYKLFSDQTNNSLPWADFPRKHIWRDLVTTWEREPNAAPANEMEGSVATVFQIAAEIAKRGDLYAIPAIIAESQVEPPTATEEVAVEPEAEEPPKKKGKK